MPTALVTSGSRVRDNAEINKIVAGLTAMGRVGLPDDKAAAAASLLTSNGDRLTGQRIEVSGGGRIFEQMGAGLIPPVVACPAAL